MFERRLKIILGLLACVIGALVLRAGQVQLFHRDYWKQQETDAMKRTHLVETTRGRILDVRGRVLAEDRPCIDACVDYRVIPRQPDEQWVLKCAVDRLHAELGDPYSIASRARRKQMRLEAVEGVKADIETMWVKLAQLSGKSIDEIDATRESITRRVEMRRRYVWYHNFEKAIQKQASSREETSAWKQWLVNGTNNGLDLDKFMVTVAEQLEPHVILPAVDNDTLNELGRHIDRYPGLLRRPGTHRYYPYGDVACHVLGHLSRVDREDLERDLKVEKGELRQYLPNDLIGKSGVESLCEPALRGTRGRYETVVGDERIATDVPPLPGHDVRLSIDIELQQQVQSAFANARIRDLEGKVDEETVVHGAAVILDVATNEVRALVSYPTYDQNQLDEQYARLVADELNRPLLNRATQSQLEPGSTVKPMVGLAAITDGLLKVDEGIECTGYLMFSGRRAPGGARCWVASKFYQKLDGHVAHHPIPWDDPHPTGFLTFSDGLERSCNVFFETVADREGVYHLSEWYQRFGLGRPTGIGISEVRGRLPIYYPLPAFRQRLIGWYAGIGQGYVAATPIQMANVAATIARGGIWARPTLLAHEPDGTLPTTRPGSLPEGPDRIDLHIPAAAIRAAREGMEKVVNAKGGTGKELVTGDAILMAVFIAGKTGTAQAAPLPVRVLDEAGHPVLDDNGKPVFELMVPSTRQNPNARAPWYRGSGADGKDISHAWYIGFAPAENPQIAFAVMVEYGGSGGVAAASVAREALNACLADGYLAAPSTRPAVAGTVSPQPAKAPAPAATATAAGAVEEIASRMARR